jgi:hypothetical protein
MTLAIGALADAEYIVNLYGETATLRGVVISIAEPHSRFNTTDNRTISVRRADGSEGTSGSTLPVRVIASAGSSEACAAVRTLLASGARLSERARTALQATL